MDFACGFWNRAHIGLLEQPRQCDLGRAYAELSGKIAQAAIAQQPAAPDRRISHYRNLVLAAKRKQVPFDAAATEVIHHLIGGTMRSTWQREQFLHIGAVEV